MYCDFLVLLAYDTEGSSGPQILPSISSEAAVLIGQNNHVDQANAIVTQSLGAEDRQHLRFLPTYRSAQHMYWSLWLLSQLCSRCRVYHKSEVQIGIRAFSR